MPPLGFNSIILLSRPNLQVSGRLVLFFFCSGKNCQIAFFQCCHYLVVACCLWKCMQLDHNCQDLLPHRQSYHRMTCCCKNHSSTQIWTHCDFKLLFQLTALQKHNFQRKYHCCWWLQGRLNQHSQHRPNVVGECVTFSEMTLGTPWLHFTKPNLS